MNRTRIKICGLTRPQDVACAVDAGADGVGVILHADSPRRIDICHAEKILSCVPPFVTRVGVFVDAPEELVAEAIERLHLGCVQFHGRETPARCSGVNVPVIKALSVDFMFSERTLEPYIGHVAGVLLDTYDPHRHGGTGTTFSWEFARGLSTRTTLVLAGGLTASNVSDAIDIVRPFAVDVSSGVESSPGIKDCQAVFAFCEAVRDADAKVRDADAKEVCR